MDERGTRERTRDEGAVLILVALLAAGLVILSGIAVQSVLARSVARTVRERGLLARQIAESAAAQALGRIKEGGQTAPHSGSGAAPEWVPFGAGDFYYYTKYDASTDTSVVRAWGRVAAAAGMVASTSALAPDDPDWDGSGWLVRGVEITVKSGIFIPEMPLFFGNGGVEYPLGGFRSGDPSDPGTWAIVTSGPSSYQADWLPFETSALDHPADYLYAGGDAEPPSAYPHPYKIWAAQNPIGQFNIQAWFTNSAGVGADPTANVSPPPTSTYYDTADASSPDYPYPIDPSVPDVQDFAWDLWNRYKDDPDAYRLGGGDHGGTYGTLDDPRITFVTGQLTVDAASTFRGVGILVIRDDYDPNVDTDNRPSNRASLHVKGTFEWTGLVIVAGWAPTVEVVEGGSATVVGAFFGEDSVQSGSEVSLDSATIIFRIRDRFRVLYSNALFRKGGLIHGYLPRVLKKVVGIRNI